MNTRTEQPNGKVKGTPHFLANRFALIARIAAVAMATLLVAISAQAQSVKLLVGFPPGGANDILARLLAEKLPGQLGTTVIVENRVGAGGQLAAQALKAAAPDGTTLFLSHDHTISILPQVVKNPGFDPTKDFTAVAGFATFVNAFAASGGTPAKSVNEYVAWIKAQGGGKGTVGVPAPASVPEFLVSQINAGVASIPDFIENHKAGKVRILAVLGGARQAALPDVPTFAELGLAGFEDVPYYGLFAPAGTPKAAIDRIADAVAKVVALPEVRERLAAMGLTVGYMSPQQLTSREQAYTQTWARIIKASGFVAQ